MRWSSALIGAVLAAALPACGDLYTSPRYVNSLRLTPDSVDLAVGETAELRIQAFDQDRDSVPDRVGRVELVSGNPAIAEVVDLEAPYATIRALSPGRTVIVAQLGFGLDRAVVRIVGPVGQKGLPSAPSHR